MTQKTWIEALPELLGALGETAWMVGWSFLIVVLLGTAVVAASAANPNVSIQDTMTAMTKGGAVVLPSNSTKNFHRKKYKTFHRMYEDYMSIRSIMIESE